ncbi:permease [Denitrovibrio acetiphilus DSM 12809]|uniref:Permease n=1 Tax=Denitrovibrio acetiphilus (strain DSM 12809 / NBRC 114555 / N2460) TaxID=522772 RepID=D4H2Z8_DENA2|nr:permease [Denitrovibrio acetiphilus]ADD69021.1 permease [Denitrovibrio acetiphilus DSM 12809]
MNEFKKLLYLTAVFLFLFFVSFDTPKMSQSILEGFFLLQDYVREHTLTCLIPALFIAGAISILISQAAVIKYFGAGANRFLAYSVASVSGSILAVCSCTILPLFAGIYRRGAGIGPATAFVYSGPAINILAIILTSKILGWEMGLARAVGAIFFSIIIGLIMALIYRNEKPETPPAPKTNTVDAGKSPAKTILFFILMTAVLIFATWAKPEQTGTLFAAIFNLKWVLAASALAGVVIVAFNLLNREERTGWMIETWEFGKQIIPLLFAGVLFAGFFLGRPGHEGIIPAGYIETLVGGNGLGAVFFSSVVGSLMYFATLTEIPILQGLIGAGMGKGPALALLLAGPALSLPNMLVIRSVIGTQKTVVYVTLVVVMSTTAGYLFGNF